MEKTNKELLAEVKKKGINIYMLLNLYKKRSKLRVDIPEEVIHSLCTAYLENDRPIRSDFPYFLQMLKKKTEEYFSKQNENESIKRHKTGRKERVPESIASIMRGIALRD